MDRLWAPWRVKYITKISKEPSGDQSIFSRMAKEDNDAANLIFVRFPLSFAVLNLYPYNNGHSLLLPYREAARLQDLTREERADLMDLLLYVQALLDDVLKPDGYNVGMNLGRVAGAGIPSHLHIHVVPRWNGDVNFMPVVSGTRVVSQSLEALYEALVEARAKRPPEAA